MWLGLVLRRREPLGSGLRVALGAANVLAVLLLLPMLASYTSGSTGHSDQAVLEQQVTPGLVSNGQQVSNVFVYDATGHRVDDVRIFDQFGQPLQVSSDVVSVLPGPEGREPVAWPPDERALSVFPLRLVPGADPWAQQDGCGLLPRRWRRSRGRPCRAPRRRTTSPSPSPSARP